MGSSTSNGRRGDPVPAVSLPARFHVVFDGCLYNSAELAAWLGMESTADDDVLVAGLLERQGVEALHRINGDFAFVAWDTTRARLLAARDRYGLRPLYVLGDGRNVAIASEIKQFFALAGVSSRAYPPRVVDFLVDGLTDHSVETLFEGVMRLPPGGFLEWDLRRFNAGDPLPAPRSWYRLPEPGGLDLGEAEAVERFRSLFLDAVRRRWQGDRPGLCLSGGLDSASVAGALSLPEVGDGRPIEAYKASFGDPRFDEPELFDNVIARHGAIPHTTYCGAAEAMAHVDDLVWYLDEPYSRASLAAQWRLFAQAGRDGIERTLDGQGADELLAGYLSMVREHEAHRRGEPYVPPFLSSRSSLAGKGEAAFSWLAPPWRELARAPGLATGPVAPRELGWLCHHRIYHGDLPMMMRHNDRIGKAHGVETSVPFLDHRVVELCLGLGGRYKIVDGATKHLLRQAMKDVLPPVVLASRQKGSYSELEEGWLRGPGVDALARDAAELARSWPGIFDERGSREWLLAPRERDKETLLLLWRVTCLGAWARRFGVDGAGA